jgi:hypothetical protein
MRAWTRGTATAGIPGGGAAAVVPVRTVLGASATDSEIGARSPFPLPPAGVTRPGGAAGGLRPGPDPRPGPIRPGRVTRAPAAIPTDPGAGADRTRTAPRTPGGLVRPARLAGRDTIGGQGIRQSASVSG